ncbi:hypothetical protein QTP70_024987 [Hemibagrus guttatus]|uniref:Uncharacterized protein n=1 Tax=Hemibagrus guttatus TaxID=175788 RepID=A0AAE0QT88_9TELE|nr:hypothetical protein QTP70_024987 [Hemibagrus guttatus]
MEMHSCRPVRVPMLTPVHHRKHQQWTREHQNWTIEQWKKVDWSDESCFLLHHVDDRVRVHHLPGEHMAPGCTMGRRRAGEGSVMLWAMFCCETLGPAIHVDVTLTLTTYLSIIADSVHPFMETALTWPPNSPDLSPIEHLWDVLDKQVRSLEASSCNLHDLKDLLLTSWCQVPQHTFRDLAESRP